MSEELKPTLSTLPPEAFQAAANAYWEKQQPESVQEAVAQPVGMAATISVGDCLLASFHDALEHDVVRPVVWPATVPVGHPLRSKKVFVKLWSSAASKLFWEIFNRKPAEPEKQDTAAEAKSDVSGLDRTYWYAIAISTCDETGKEVFQFEEFPSEADYAALQDVACTLPMPSKPELLGKQLELKYNSPKGKIWSEPLWEQAMIFNGMLASPAENLEAKNSDGTATSASSDASSV